MWILNEVTSPRFNLPDFNFIEADPSEIETEMIHFVEEETGQSLLNNLPKRMFVKSCVSFVSMWANRLDYALKQQLLSYAEDEPLDHKGAEIQTPRLEEKHAKTQMLIKLSPERVDPLKIKKGTRFLRGQDVYFETLKDYTVPVEQLTVVLDAQCTETGTFANGYLPSEITTMVDAIPYAISAENITTTSGGADIEEDENYAERIRLAPEKLSTAGPDLAYEYFAKQAHQSIEDVYVLNPLPGVVQIVVLLEDGGIPSQEILNQVEAACTDNPVRPLTDKLLVNGPEQVLYEMKVSYKLSKDKQVVLDAMKEKIEQAFRAYLSWQRSKLGRDVNSSELIARLREAGAERVTVHSLPYVDVGKYQIAKDDVTSITFDGFEDA